MPFAAGEIRITKKKEKRETGTFRYYDAKVRQKRL
jgi:hypothetical protein